MSQLIPPELLKWADIPTITLVILACELLKPIVEDWAWFKADPDRIIALPLLLGTVLGILIEATTASFDPAMALRRVLVDAFGSAGVFKGIKTFLPSKEGG